MLGPQGIVPGARNPMSASPVRLLPHVRGAVPNDVSPAITKLQRDSPRMATLECVPKAGDPGYSSTSYAGTTISTKIHGKEKQWHACGVWFDRGSLMRLFLDFRTQVVISPAVLNLQQNVHESPVSFQIRRDHFILNQTLERFVVHIEARHPGLFGARNINTNGLVGTYISSVAF